MGDLGGSAPVSYGETVVRKGADPFKLFPVEGHQSEAKAGSCGDIQGISTAQVAVGGKVGGQAPHGWIHRNKAQVRQRLKSAPRPREPGMAGRCDARSPQPPRPTWKQGSQEIR